MLPFLLAQIISSPPSINHVKTSISICRTSLHEVPHPQDSHVGAEGLGTLLSMPNPPTGSSSVSPTESLDTCDITERSR